ncbi:MAG: glutamyl-tRNA synthetase, partial [Amphiamblys sp. WSBS2006]
SFDIKLQNTKDGEVVTRFPPEPSGYLHIGHAKAILLNDYFARKYNGKLIVRFDDTNPSKEKDSYKEAILEDLVRLGIEPDTVTHTSDYFALLHGKLLEMVQKGHAYADNTPQEEMRRQRGVGEASRCRSNTVEENLEALAKMERGDPDGEKYCVRAKISVDNKNKAMRDPVIYRCNTTPHCQTGTAWRIYPTYDFACPIVDSHEGITHALRTSEYCDRKAQYSWFLDTLGMRQPQVWEYSRVGFVYTALSKRKLGLLVDEGVVSGWDDPRMPTIKGILRRGLLPDALRKYILLQGALKNILLLEWDKLWATNAKILTNIVPRYTAIPSKDACTLVIDGVGADEERTVLKYSKAPELGTKQKVYARTALIDHADAAGLEEGEEVTLMGWGNIVVTEVARGSGKTTLVTARLHLDGDFKKTKKKLTWIAKKATVPVLLKDYDLLLAKKKLEEGDSIMDALNPETEFEAEYLAESSMGGVGKGDFVQLERNGNFVCDAPGVLLHIPDGKASTSKWISVQKNTP